MNIESCLSVSYVEKDVNLIITKCNSILAKYLGFKSKEDVIGKTDFDLCLADHAPEYRKHDMDALSGIHYTTIIPVKNYNGDLLLFNHTKISKKDNKGNINGLISCATEILNPDIYELIQILSKINNEKNPVYTLSKKYLHIALSQREEQCLFYLVYGKTAKMIGKILGLSPRTVEHYIDNIKSKFGCNTKMELIDKAINEGYLKNIPNFLTANTLTRGLKN